VALAIQQFPPVVPFNNLSIHADSNFTDQHDRRFINMRTKEKNFGTRADASLSMSTYISSNLILSTPHKLTFQDETVFIGRAN